MKQFCLALLLLAMPTVAFAQAPSPAPYVPNPTSGLPPIPGTVQFCWNGTVLAACGSGIPPTPLAGIVPGIAGSAAASVVLKSSSGTLFSVYATSSAAGWLMIFNATSLPSNGSTTAGTATGNMQHCVPLAANGTTSITYNGGPPEPFSAGIVAAISSTGCATLTAESTGFIHGIVQ